MDQSRIARQVDDAWLEDVYRDLYPRAKVATWKAWAAEVRRIDVEITPGGRAVLRHPDARWSMELRWRPTDPNKTGYASQALLTTCWMTADPGEQLPWEEMSVGMYVTALQMRLSHRWRETGHKADDPEDMRPPASGRPASLGFYRNLIAEYDELLNSGEKTPIRVLAVRYGVAEGTVKSWRSRGQQYLRRGAASKEETS